MNPTQAQLESLAASDNAGEAAKATVQSPRIIGSTSISVDTTTNWPTGTFIATTGTLQPDGTLNPTTVQVFYGTASGTTITITSFAAGYTDKGNAIGDVVVLKPTTEWANIVAGRLGGAPRMPYYFQVSLSNNLTGYLANMGQPYIVPFNYIEADPQGKWNGTTYEYTIPISGWWQINMSVVIYTSSLNIYANAYVERNGALLYEQQSQGSTQQTYPSPTISRFGAMTAGDVISVYAFAGSANQSIEAVAASTQFGGFLVSQ